MGLSVNLVQLKRKKRKDRTIPIYIRITQNRKSQYKSTGIAVLPKHWDNEQKKIRPSHPLSTVLNNHLRHQWSVIKNEQQFLKQKGQLEADTLKQAIAETSYNDLLNYADAYLKKLQQDDRYWEHKHFKVVRGNLEGYLEGQNIPISTIDADFLEGFQRYLLNEAGSDSQKKGNSPNTVRKKLQRLKGMTKTALQNGDINHDPFADFEPVAKQPTNNKTILTLPKIKAIKSLKLEKGSRLWHTRNYFLFSFYNAGIRFGDLCCLRWENFTDGRLVYQMNKNGQEKNILQDKPMIKILIYYKAKKKSDHGYIFPILDKKYSDPFALRKAIASKNVGINQDLKVIAKKAGIEKKVSFQVSQHSFAHFALEKGMGLYSISKALGHSSLKSTQTYLKKIDDQKVDKEMKELLKEL